jgi:hypothetical protein
MELLTSAFRNIQKVFGVLYGTPYKDCFDSIITALDDEESVFRNYDDFYVHTQFEIVISKFYSDIRYEKQPVIYLEMRMDTPEKCALLLQHHLDVELMQARGKAPTGNWERQPHSKFYSRQDSVNPAIVITPN